MAFTAINSEDRLVQATFADHLQDALGWDSIYAWSNEDFGPSSLLGRVDDSQVILARDLKAALERLNPDLPGDARKEALEKLTRVDFSRSILQHNEELYAWIRDGVPVQYRDDVGAQRDGRVQVIDFRDASANRFLCARELWIRGLRVPYYRRRADLVCFVNGLPVVFIELKAVYKNIREGYERNLRDYLDERVIGHAFHHNAFVIVSNGDRARYGSITSGWEHFCEWKRNDESEAGDLDARVLLDGMLAKNNLLDLLENFILFDNSHAGAPRKIVARNHQVLGVNRAVAAVRRQEALKREYPVEERKVHRWVAFPVEDPDALAVEDRAAAPARTREVEIAERAHPDLGRLGVFWHTQGSGKSYSMAFFAEKVRRTLVGNFTFLIMTDRKDLDSQIYRTFVGCGVADEQTPRAVSGDALRRLLRENHRYVFSLIHKFNRDVSPDEPYSDRDDIIVVSDEAHRTQSGRLAANLRAALPNAAFIGFTGTPLFTHDELTRRIFGDYISRYDFARSAEDGSTVRLVYESRGEKLGIERLDLNDRMAEAIDAAELDDDQSALLEKLLGKEYEVVTADDRLDKIALDFVEHYSARWESGKALLVCIDKVTCGRMWKRIVPLWIEKAAALRREARGFDAGAERATEEDVADRLREQAEEVRTRAAWMDETVTAVIVSEAQNEVRDFEKWGVDILPHRELMKEGFETADGKRKDVESAFKDPDHPFRVGIVCAMWLTGFDCESLATLYIDKPMKAHTLMQAIARANRRFPGKDFGLIVDYNGVLKSLRAALAQYALGDDGQGGEEIVEPIEERVVALLEAIEATEAYVQGLGFDLQSIADKHGFERIQCIRDAVDAVQTNDESRRRFGIMARQVFIRFKSLVNEPAAHQFAERHDNIEAVYKKLNEKRDTADVTDVLKALHRIVNEAIGAQPVGADHTVGLTVDLSTMDLEKLRDEFANNGRRKATAVQDLRTLVEQKLADMLARNPARMDYYRRYQEIVADYNREKDRVAIEDTFASLVELIEALDAEAQRTVREGLDEASLAMFDLLVREDLTKAQREQIKAVSKELLESVRAEVGKIDKWYFKDSTRADVETLVLDWLWEKLPTPPYTSEEKESVAKEVYGQLWQQAMSEA